MIWEGLTCFRPCLLPPMAEGGSLDFKRKRWGPSGTSRNEAEKGGRAQPHLQQCLWDVRSDSSASKLPYFQSLIIFAKAQLREKDFSANHIPLEDLVINKLHPTSRNNFPWSIMNKKKSQVHRSVVTAWHVSDSKDFASVAKSAPDKTSHFPRTRKEGRK